MRAQRVLTVVALAAVATAVAMVSATARPKQQPKPEDVVIEGRVVDLFSYMNGQFTSEDPAKETRDNIRSGVPAGLEIDEGIIVIGMGKQNPARKLLPFAFKEVELTGKLYDKDGLLYVDMQEVRAPQAEGAAEGEQPTDQPQPAPDGDHD